MSAITSPPIDFFDLTGGLNTVATATHLTRSEARDLQNVDLSPIGGISKRNGYATLNSTALSANAMTGFYQARFSTAGGTNVIYAVNGTSLYSLTSAGVKTDRTNSQTITYAANNIWNFDILNDIVVAMNNTDAALQISTSSVATTLSGLPFTTALFPVQYRGYMFYWNCLVSATQQYDRGYFSSINDPATVGTNNFIDIAKKQGGDVRGAVDYQTYLFVFKRNGIFQINYQPTRVNSAGTLFPFTETPNPVVPGVGTQSHRSICKFTTPETHVTPAQELVFFVDQFGCPRIFDGKSTFSFSSKIGTSRDASIINLSLMDRTRAPYAFSVNYPDKNIVLCFLSRSNSQQDTVFCLDYSTKFSLTRYKYASSFNVGALIEKTNGSFKPFVGDYAGGVFELDSGTSDNGQPIDSYYVTGDVFNTSPMIQSNWSEMEMRGTTGSTSQAVTTSFYADGSDTPSIADTKVLANPQTTWGSFVWGQAAWGKQGLVQRTQEIRLDSKTLRTKVGNSNLNETFTLEGWSLANTPLGVRQA